MVGPATAQMRAECKTGLTAANDERFDFFGGHGVSLAVAWIGWCCGAVRLICKRPAKAVWGVWWDQRLTF